MMIYIYFERIQPGVKDSGVEGSREMLKNYRELQVWQKSYEFYLDFNRITKKFPKKERCGLIFQIRRSAVSVPSKVGKIVGEQVLGPFPP